MGSCSEHRQVSAASHSRLHSHSCLHTTSHPWARHTWVEIVVLHAVRLRREGSWGQHLRSTRRLLRSRRRDAPSPRPSRAAATPPREAPAQAGPRRAPRPPAGTCGVAGQLRRGTPAAQGRGLRSSPVARHQCLAGETSRRSHSSPGEHRLCTAQETSLATPSRPRTTASLTSRPVAALGAAGPRSIYRPSAPTRGGPGSCPVRRRTSGRSAATPRRSRPRPRGSARRRRLATQAVPGWTWHLTRCHWKRWDHKCDHLQLRCGCRVATWEVAWARRCIPGATKACGRGRRCRRTSAENASRCSSSSSSSSSTGDLRSATAGVAAEILERQCRPREPPATGRRS
mmetsp:Transcript_49430/g.159545  ORF Transcript_49430/g.159545 Transcript_49430/m.159545 type:complete len:343 (+) Transcript_49430:610-1638(+)